MKNYLGFLTMFVVVIILAITMFFITLKIEKETILNEQIPVIEIIKDEPLGAVNVYDTLDLKSKLNKTKEINNSLKSNHTINNVNGNLLNSLINNL